MEAGRQEKERGDRENNQTLTRTRQVSTNENVPERPIPALQ